MPTVLQVRYVSKAFQLHRNRPVTLKESLVRRFTGRHDQANQVWALQNVSFAVERGRSLGIIGHNGAGKSTLLRLICGLGRPTSGTIQCVGHVSGLLELGSGFHPDMSGRENIMTGGLLSGMTAREVRAQIDEIVAFAELEDAIDQPIRTYSNGMYLRLAFAASMQFNPSVLAIDEILAVGDIRFQEKCYRKLDLFRAAGKTLLLTSHSVEQIRALCDEVLVLEEGRVVMQGDPELAIDCYTDLMRQRTERRVAQLGAAGPISATPVLAEGSRQGTQEASISAVTLYDSRGGLASSLLTGSALAIEIDYAQNQPIDDMAFILGIYSESNIKCFETTIPSLRAAFGPLAGTGRFRCQIPALPLLSGRYFVDVGLYPSDWSYVYDYHWRMHPLRVVTDAPAVGAQGGVIALQFSWAAEPAAISVADQPID
jgi:lipopolysaccharide transport system ATP-binding protein